MKKILFLLCAAVLLFLSGCSDRPPELSERLRSYLERRGPSDGYWQEGSSATAEMIPAWDLSGLQEENTLDKRK